MDAGDACPVIAQNSGCDHHSAAVFLRGGDRPPRLESARGDNGFDPNRRLVFRAKGVPCEQPGRRGVFHSLLEHERTVFHRVPAVLRSGWGNCVVQRSILQGFPASQRCGPFPATNAGARPASLDALQL